MAGGESGERRNAPREPFPAVQLPRAIALLAIALIISYAALASAGWRVAATIAGWSDLAAYFLPKSIYLAERIRAGALPLWNPWEFCGIPFLATAQPAVFYPPVPLSYLLWNGVTAHVVLFFFHVALGAVGTLLLMRSFGYGVWPCVLGSLWVSQPLWLVRVYDHPNLLATVAWVPWIVLLVRRCCVAPSLRAAAGLAVVAALQFLAGYPFAVVATGYLVLMGVPLWLWEGRRRGRGAPWSAALALVVAIGVWGLLVAAQLLPTAELTLSTNRQSNAAFVQELLRQVGDDASSLLAFGTPHVTLASSARDFWRTFGPAAIALAMLAVVAHRRDAAVWWLLGAVVLCGLLPYPAYLRLPLYGQVRYAFEWRLIAPMMVFMLAACGLDVLLVRGWLWPRAAAACAMAVVLVGIAWNWRQLDPTWLRPPSREPKPLPQWANPECQPDDRRFRAYWPFGQAQARLFTARVPSIGGYEASLLPARTARLNETLDIGVGVAQPRWDESITAARTIAARMGLRCLPAPRVRKDRVTVASRLQRYLLRHAQPRLRLVRRAQFAASGEDAFRLLWSNPATVVLETAPQPLGPCSGPPGTPAIVSEKPEDVRIAVDARCDGYLVLADTKLAGWSATLDGRAVPIITADYAFRAVRIPAGTHEVRFRYAPWTVPAGVVASLAGIALALGLMLLPRRYDPLWHRPATAP